MFSKIYEKIKIFIKEYYKLFVFVVIMFAILTFEFPYYISAPGGLIDTSEKIKSTSNFKSKGSLNMAYVSEIKATLPTLIFSELNPNWDIEREGGIKHSNEDMDEKAYRNKLLLKEASNDALIVAYKKADIKYEMKNNQIYVTYIDKHAKTDLKVQDELLKVDGKKIKNKQELYDYISSKKKGDTMTFTVKNNGKTYKRTATLYESDGKTRIGINVGETYDIKSNKNIEFNFKDSESGSSGGLMLALTAYSNLTNKDLTDGKIIAGTGTIDANGKVGDISGVKYKLIGAVNKHADVFLVPQGKNYIEARNLKKEKGYKIDIVPVETFDDALKYLEKQ